MKERKMYALTYCYEGTYDNNPWAMTLDVSYDLGILKQKMSEYISENCKKDADDEWNFECNFEVWKETNDSVTLNHLSDRDLFVTYSIEEVELI